MPRRTLKPSVGILILAIVAILAISLRFVGGKDLIPWRTDFKAARQEAQTAHKPMLVDFSATWCEACVDMKRRMFSRRDVAAAADKFVPVTVDFDTHRDLGLQYDAQYLPTLAIVDASDGKLIRKLEGEPEDSDELIHWLNQ